MSRAEALQMSTRQAEPRSVLRLQVVGFITVTCVPTNTLGYHRAEAFTEGRCRRLRSNADLNSRKAEIYAESPSGR